jgi:hypothetical protein
MFLRNPDFHGFRNGSTAVGLPFSDVSIPSYSRRAAGGSPRSAVPCAVHVQDEVVSIPSCFRRSHRTASGPGCGTFSGSFHPTVFPSDAAVDPIPGVQVSIPSCSRRTPGGGWDPPSFTSISIPPWFLSDDLQRNPGTGLVRFHPTMGSCRTINAFPWSGSAPFPSHHGSHRTRPKRDRKAP